MSHDSDASDVPQALWFRARSPHALGTAVASARRARGLTQTELAGRTSSSRATVSRLERGGSTTTDTLLDALARCGYEVVVVPRDAKVTVT